MNALLKNGIDVLRATSTFSVNGKSYPTGSYVVKTAQAFRPMIRDMFEPQDHPHDAAYPGGPPVQPYDIAGWTMSMQMGVDCDRVMEKLDGPFVAVKELQTPSPGKISGVPNPVGHVISHRTNNSFILTNRLLKAGVEVELQNHPLMDPIQVKLDKLAARQKGEANPFVVGQANYQKFLDVMADCTQVNIARRK